MIYKRGIYLFLLQSKKYLSKRRINFQIDFRALDFFYSSTKQVFHL